MWSRMLARYMDTFHVVRGLQNSQGSVMNSLHRIAGGGAEAMEFTVGAGTRNLEVPLKDLRLRSGVDRAKPTTATMAIASRKGARSSR